MTPAMLSAQPSVRDQAVRVVAAYGKIMPRKLPPIACTEKSASCDWRTFAKVTAPKWQSCGDCCAFATAGQVESAMLMAGWSQDDLSEQQILDCSGAGDCAKGGWRPTALAWIIGGTGVANEPSYPYAHGVKNACKPISDGPGKLLASAMIDPSGAAPSVATLKQYIAEYGPISVSIRATPLFQSCGGNSNEVFNEQNNGDTNHAILVIGWDDSKQAWLMKNSGGPYWGFDGGYGWVHYGSNNIGRNAVWAKASAPQAKFSPELLQEIQAYRKATLPFIRSGALPR